MMNQPVPCSKHFLSLLFFVLVGIPAALATPQAYGGIIDLTEYDLAQEVVDLDGQWSFSLGFTDPGEELLQNVPVPAIVRFGETGYDPEGELYGHGTYRLLIRHAPLEDPLSLYIPMLGTASAFYINGQLVSQQGIPGTSLATERALNRPQLIEIPLYPNSQNFEGQSLEEESPLGTENFEELELVIQFSNYGDVISGITSSIKLGSRRDIEQLRTNYLLFDAVIFGALFLMGLYHLGFFFNRTKDPSTLYFALLCILIAIRTTCSEQLIFLDAFPGIDWTFFTRIMYTSTYLLPPAFLGFINALFPSKASKGVFYSFLGINVFYLLIVWVTPMVFFTSLLSVMNIFMALAGGLGLSLVIGAALAKKEGSPVFLIGTSILVLTAINDMLRIHILLQTPQLTSWGIIAFLMAQALLLTRKFTIAYEQTETHSEYLEKLAQSLERFIPKQILQYLGRKSIMDIRLGDFSEEIMTVMFLDIRDFTSLSESMTPQDNFNFINNFLKEIGPKVREYGGFIDKYVGDGIMALFPNSPSDAVQAALEMRNQLKEYNIERQKAGLSKIAFGIGMHYGPLMIGTIGESFRMDSTVISDTVNVASRLEKLTKEYQEDILLSGPTFEALPPEDRSLTLYKKEETLRGKKIALSVYAIS